LKPPFRGMRNTDYAANFDDFLSQVKKDQPFCFWLGTSEPHRGYELGAGKRTGKDPAKVIVPKIFPDHPVVRSDILDYYVEVEHFDKMVARAIKTLEKRANWTTPSWWSRAITVCRFHGPKPAFTTTVHGCLWPSVGPRASRIPVARRIPA